MLWIGKHMCFSSRSPDPHSLACRAAERGEAQCRQHVGHDTSDGWRLGHGRHMPLLGS
jgi:hypothetical protein